MGGDPTGFAAIARLWARPEVTGVQVLKERPTCVGVRRGEPPEDKWTWFYGATPALALAQAEAGLREPRLKMEER